MHEKSRTCRFAISKTSVSQCWANNRSGHTRVLKLYLVNKGEISLMLPLSAAAVWMSWIRRGVWVSEPEILLCLQPGSQLKLLLAASDVGQRMGDYIEYGEEMNFKLSLT